MPTSQPLSNRRLPPSTHIAGRPASVAGVSLFMAAQLAVGATSTRAFAGEPVQPVPYAQSQPVPYAQPQPAQTTQSLAPAPPAYATGNDVVILKSGGMIRGTLIEAIPNDHATVQLATGQNAIIQWDHIHHIERGANAAAPAPAPIPTQPAAPVSEGPTARVHIDSDRPVNLESRSGTIGNIGVFNFVCASPCDIDLPLSREYRINGSGVRASSPFRLAARPGEHVTLDINTSSSGAFAGGIVLVSLGPITSLVGLIIVGIASAEKDTNASFSSSGSGTTVFRASNSDLDSRITGGWITVGVGLAMIAGGVLLIASNTHSTVDQEPQAPRRDAWKRLPTWREDPAAAVLPKAATMPLFSGSF